MDRFCLIDIGSTTSKAFLFCKETAWRHYRCESPTTVEKPYEDVTIGVVNAISELETVSGHRLLEDNKPAVPIFATSSAGGGLAMIVAGLVGTVTAHSAELVGLGAGGILQDVIALDDNRTPYQKIELLKKLRPDIMLLAGGFDGGAVFGPVFLAELLRQAELRPKLGTLERLPIIYAGNADARQYVAETLGDKYTLIEAPNIRPSSDRENLEPARDAIHDCFMDHVMSRAPGYDRFTKWVSAPILPTPAAVAKLLELISANTEGAIMAIDIGGATTDVFTAENGRVFRTVSANLGLSYSILNVVRQTGVDAISRLMGFDIKQSDLLNYIGNKYIHPTTLPSTAEGTKIECAVASMAVREAVKAHLQVLRNVAMSRSGDALGWGMLRQKETRKPRSSGRMDLSVYRLVIGSGGKLSHSAPDTAAAILINALNPATSLELAIDNAFIFPQLGVLSQSEPELAQTLYRECGLIRLGRFIPCTGRPKEGEPAVEITVPDDPDAKPQTIECGKIVILPMAEHGKHEYRLRSRRLRVPDDHVIEIEDSRLILDARGDEPEPPCDWFLPYSYKPEVRSVTEKADTTKTTIIEEHRELALPGDVLVRVGDRVEPDTLVARCTQSFRRPFFIDVAERLNLKGEYVPRVLKVKTGDEIRPGDVIASFTPGIDDPVGSEPGDSPAGPWKNLRAAFSEPKTVRSTVSGIVEKILPNGTVIVREKDEVITSPYTVKVLEELEIRPRQFERCLRCEVGQEVEKDQIVAIDGTVSIRTSRRCRSPIRGRVRSINTKYGIIVIEPMSRESQVHAWLPGVVSSVSDRGCTVSLSGTLIRGV